MFFRDLKIRTKITLVVLLVVIISVFAISYLSYVQTKSSVEKKYSDTFSVISNMKMEQIDKIFEELDLNIKYMSKSRPVVDNLKKLRYLRSYKDSTYYNIKGELDKELFPKQVINGYTNIILTDNNGKVLYTSYRFPTSIVVGERNNKEFDKLISLSKEDKSYFGAPFFIDKEVYQYVVSPLMKTGGVSLGYVIVLYNLEKNIFPIVESHTGLGETGEILLSRVSDKRLTFINPSKHRSFGALTEILLEAPDNNAAKKAAMGESDDFGYDIDYRGVKTLAYWNFIPSVKWGLVVKMDYDEVKHGLDGLVLIFIQSSVIIILLSTLIATIFSKYLTSPIVALKNHISLVARGVLPDNIVENAENDEIGEMSLAVHDVVNAMKRTANFAGDIGRGDYRSDFEPMSEDDTLGNALLAMRDSIKSAEDKDSERTWIVSGVAEVGQILRSYSNLEDLGSEVLSFVSSRVSALQGAFYVTDTDYESDADNDLLDGNLVMKASYAYGKKRFLQGSYKFAEGLVGQAAAEQDTIVRVEIPDDYMKITSGLFGEQKPKCILIVPLIANEKVYGVLEFAGFSRFTPVQVTFVEEISVIIARTIFNIKVNDRTVRLLQESQKMSQELKLQQDILRQNAEEMEATQEELKRTNNRLEEKVKEVSHSQKRMQVLLENASEVITIFEENGSIRYVSPSVKPILGYTTDEVTGSYGQEFVHQDSMQHFQKFFEQLASDNTSTTHTIQYEFKQKDGSTVWLEATGKNLLSDPAINGIVMNARDITERRRAEQEKRMRSQMQSLSENSRDLILRINSDGVIFYVNPTIKAYTGSNQELLLGKSLKEIELPKRVVAEFDNLVTEVVNTQSNCDREMEIPTVEGGKIVLVNAIPEFNEVGEVESVLLVAHDITARKKAELEILSTNKKIKESINYAQRIQRAILPDNDVIRKELKDSFVLYKPRDVVSGDFPWYFKKGDDLYIAVVDCTGHGVPGALISLIGYFILNDIVGSGDKLTTGEVLDRLDEGVTKTLRQDVNGDTRDGMDISLLKINSKSNQIEYAGAHRPLYYYSVSEEQLIQVKGDRLSIGGSRRRSQNSFSSTQLEMNAGDELYLFSDGLTDQFGGNDNKKFGPQKVREIISSRKHKDMTQMKDLFEDNFIQWKGNNRQTDDVLLIGVKF
ncbi:PAS domain S-box protein [Limibacter armeniacum]|uniref:PAS domain S-box protein n=1 Tax=Limibacter armeniacum TaxID=466084 RepID=UPI002FE61DA5